MSDTINLRISLCCLNCIHAETADTNPGGVFLPLHCNNPEIPGLRNNATPHAGTNTCDKHGAKLVWVDEVARCGTCKAAHKNVNNIGECIACGIDICSACSGATAHCLPCSTGKNQHLKSEVDCQVNQRITEGVTKNHTHIACEACGNHVASLSNLSGCVGCEKSGCTLCLDFDGRCKSCSRLGMQPGSEL